MRCSSAARAALAAILAAAVLAACGGTPKSASDPERRARQLPPPGSGREPVELVFPPPVGPRPDLAAKMAAAVAVALRDYGIVALPIRGDDTATAPAARRVDSTVRTGDLAGDVRIDILWTIRDPAGKAPATIEQSVIGTPREWYDGDDRLVSRIAQQAAFRIARLQGRADPRFAPLSVLAEATPHLPAEPAAPPEPPGVTPASLKPTVSPAASAAPGGGPVSAAAVSAPRVRVMAVTGAGDEGNRALTSAMRRALGESQIVLVDQNEPGGFQLQGTVELGAAVEGRQRLTIRWVLKRGDGAEVGDLAQSNNVRAGSLTGHWGELAPIIALAASEGVVTLLNRAR
ncbi:MAG: hypothetical protein IPK81_16510 [Rhodospirillales bacterium]|nr:MAG: hypothetical protein IPK81_16510 [Rhodospirillales bacterium]